jgi:hypothetical protein
MLFVDEWNWNNFMSNPLGTTDEEDVMAYLKIALGRLSGETE